MTRLPLLFCVGLFAIGCANPARFDALRPEAAVVEVRAGTDAPGRGFFVSPDGTIVTSRHVLGDARLAAVTTADGRRLNATLLSEDAEADVAVLKVPTPVKGQEFRILHLDDEDAIPGGHVRAVGGGGVTHGVFDHWEDLGRVIDFTAPVGPTDAGAPLLTDDGRVIGVVIGPFESHYKAAPAWQALRMLPALGRSARAEDP